MIASCPSCATRFAVDEAKLGPAGRKVKCGKCGHLWLQHADGGAEELPQSAPARPIDIPPPSIIEQGGDRAEKEREEVPAAAAEEAAAVETPEPENVTPIARAVAPPPKRRSGKRIVAMLLAVLAVLGLLGVGVMALRGGEAGKNPIVAGVLGMLGLHEQAAETDGLGFENVSTARRTEGTVQLLVVTGDVVNGASAARIIPPLRGALLASDNREVQNWTFAAKAEKVEPGQRVKFETTLRSPAAEATDVKVTFAPAGS